MDDPKPSLKFKFRLNLMILFFMYTVQNRSSSHPKVFHKKGVFRNFTKFTGKHLCQSLFVNKVGDLRLATLLKRDSGAGVFL